MIHSAPAVDTTFTQLVAALDAESVELKKIGGEVFHGGAPRQAQSLLLRAKSQAALRDRIAALHEEWKSGISSARSQLYRPLPTRGATVEER